MKKDFVFRMVLVAGIALVVYLFGIKPFLSGDIFFERDKNSLSWAKGVSSNDRDIYDVVVFGEDGDGIAAAVSAARLGARTLLVSKGKDLGGIVTGSLLTSLDFPYGAAREILNGGISAELNHMAGKTFAPAAYKKAVEKLVDDERKIEVLYSAKLASVRREGGTIDSLTFDAVGRKVLCKGRIYIDATHDGDLLAACGAKYFRGSEDLNLKASYMPLRLNFVMKGESAYKITALLSKDKNIYLSAVKKGYVPTDVKIKINNLNVVSTDVNTVIVQGIEVSDVDVDDAGQVKSAYAEAVSEARELSAFLAAGIPEFKGWKFAGTAEKLFIPEYRHFEGFSTLSVNNVLENRYFDDTVAMGSMPVQGCKLAGGAADIIGQPVQYGIPLGSIVPKSVDNLLMTGAKASYSSLASSSAGTPGTSIATGEAAGVAAVYALLKGTTPSDFLKNAKTDAFSDIQKYLTKQSFYIPRREFKNANDGNWSYPAVRQLVSLGLVTGGTANDFRFGRTATQSDLALLLLNGIYRVNPHKYSLALDSRLRSHFTAETLTKKRLGEIIAALYDIKASDPYTEVCKQGYINNIATLRLKDRDVLNMEDVYYIAVYNIRFFTGEEIKD